MVSSFSTKLVGVAGFEPTASWTRTKRATKLRYTPSENLFPDSQNPNPFGLGF